MTKPRKVVLLGSSSNTCTLAPFDDPDWEIWGLTWRYRDHPRMDRCYEIHAEKFWDDYAGDLYRAWLNDPRTFDEEKKPVAVYLRPDVQARFPNCKPIPIPEICELMGREYFASSFSYMLGHAILEGVDEIAMWGIDLVVGEEYDHQRPNAEFLLGIAHARGIKITVPWQSSLLNHPFVYGPEAAPEESPLYTRAEAKLAEYQKRIKEAKEMIFTWEGACHEVKEVMSDISAIKRGSLGGEVPR